MMRWYPSQFILQQLMKAGSRHNGQRRLLRCAAALVSYRTEIRNLGCQKTAGCRCAYPLITRSEYGCRSCRPTPCCLSKKLCVACALAPVSCTRHEEYPPSSRFTFVSALSGVCWFLYVGVMQDLASVEY